MKGDILMYSGKLKFYYNKESNELIIADKDMVVVDNLFTDKIAVHVPTQEDVEYISSKLSIKMDWVKNGIIYKNSFPNIYISLFSGKWGYKDTFEKHHSDCNYHIITIDQFKELFKDEAPKHEKVYIRGNKTRGAEVLAKLKSLGGVNKLNCYCKSINIYYFINEFGLINYKTEPLIGYTEIFLDEPVPVEPTKEQVELKVVEYAKSVNWDYEKIIELLLCRIISEEFMILDGDNPSDKAQKIFDKYKPKSESEPDITELKSDKTDESGYKQSENKLSYELDWNFITQMAERMEANKGKYEPYNWKKPIDTQELRNAITRHAIEVAKGNFADDGRPFGHLEALACNSMMLNFQLQNKK